MSLKLTIKFSVPEFDVIMTKDFTCHNIEEVMACYYVAYLEIDAINWMRCKLDGVYFSHKRFETWYKTNGKDILFIEEDIFCDIKNQENVIELRDSHGYEFHALLGTDFYKKCVKVLDAFESLNKWDVEY